MVVPTQGDPASAWLLLRCWSERRRAARARGLMDRTRAQIRHYRPADLGSPVPDLPLDRRRRPGRDLALPRLPVARALLRSPVWVVRAVAGLRGRRHPRGGRLHPRRARHPGLRRTAGKQLVAQPACPLSRPPAQRSAAAVDIRPADGAHHPPSLAHPGPAGRALPLAPAHRPAATPAGPRIRPAADPDTDHGPARAGSRECTCTSPAATGPRPGSTGTSASPSFPPPPPNSPPPACTYSAWTCRPRPNAIGQRAQLSSLIRIRVPAGSRKAQSRTPYGCSAGSWTTSAPLACSRANAPSRSAVARVMIA